MSRPCRKFVNFLSVLRGLGGVDLIQGLGVGVRMRVGCSAAVAGALASQCACAEPSLLAGSMCSAAAVEGGSGNA